MLAGSVMTSKSSPASAIRSRVRRKRPAYSSSENGGAKLTNTCVELARHGRDGSVQHLDHVVDLLLADNKRRRNGNHIARQRTDNHAFGERRQPDFSRRPQG